MYTSKTTIQGYLGVTLDSGLDTFITLAIAAVQNYIDNYCGDQNLGKRVFEKPDPDAATTRYFDGNGETKLYIGEATAVSALSIDGVAQVVNEDYYLYPLNAADMGKPYEWIELIQPNGRKSSRVGTSYVFERDQRNVIVTGKFRYSDTAPADIQLIATKLASEFLKERLGDQLFREVKSETFGDYSITYNDIGKAANALGVSTILDQYKRRTASNKLGTILAS